MSALYGGGSHTKPYPAVNTSGRRSSTVRYDDSNHWRIGGGDASTSPAMLACRPDSKASATATTTVARHSLLRALRPQDLGAAIELGDVRADPVIRGEVPIAEYSPIGSLELHVRLEKT